jgi:hypothetical protein
MLGVSGGWPLGHPAELVGVKLLHEVSAFQVAAGDVHHSLVVTIDGPDVETQLGLSAAADHIPLVIRRAGDGACTTHPELHSYAASATARAFGETGALDGAWVPLQPLHAEEDAVPDAVRGVDGARRVRPVRCGLRSVRKPHSRLGRASDAAKWGRLQRLSFPELSKPIVDGVPQVEN